MGADNAAAWLPVPFPPACLAVVFGLGVYRGFLRKGYDQILQLHMSKKIIVNRLRGE